MIKKNIKSKPRKLVTIATPPNSYAKQTWNKFIVELNFCLGRGRMKLGVEAGKEQWTHSIMLCSGSPSSYQPILHSFYLKLLQETQTFIGVLREVVKKTDILRSGWRWALQAVTNATVEPRRQWWEVNQICIFKPLHHLVKCVLSVKESYSMCFKT